MVFLKRSTTALLAVLLFSFASTVYTTKAHAQEVSAKDTCLITQFTVLGNSSCKPKRKPVSEFMPTTTLIPTPPQEEPKKEEPKNHIITQPVMSYASNSAELQPNTASLSADVLFSMVNSYRNNIGLSSFEHEKNVCDVAESRRDEMVTEIFVTHQLHAGFYAKNLTYWATENLIWQHTETQALNWWLHSPVHKAAIEGNYKYACGVCNGEVCNMVFTNYDPKVIISSASVVQTRQPPQQPQQQPAPQSDTDSKKNPS